MNTIHDELARLVEICREKIGPVPLEIAVGDVRVCSRMLQAQGVAPFTMTDLKRSAKKLRLRGVVVDREFPPHIFMVRPPKREEHVLQP